MLTIHAAPADGGASFFENLPEGGALGEAAGGISRAPTLSPRSPRPGGADDAGVAGAAEADIQRALLVGNYAAALDACLAVRPDCRELETAPCLPAQAQDTHDLMQQEGMHNPPMLILL